MNPHAGLTRFIHHHGLWRGLVWGVCIVAAYDGASFAVLGNQAVGASSRASIPPLQGGSFALLVRYPGLVFYGWLLLGLAGVLVYASHMGGQFAHRVLQGAFVAYLWLVVATIAGWEVSGRVTTSTLGKWAFLAWACVWLSVTGPAGRRSDAG